MKRMMTLAALATLACSCSIYKEYQRPQDVCSDSLYGIEASDSSSVASLSWEDFFKDEDLQALIRKGLEQNRSLRIAAQRIIEAQASLDVARMSFLPTPSLSPSLSFAQSETRYDGSAFGYGVSPSAGWEIDLRGSLYNQKRRAQAAYEQSLIYRQSVQTELVASIARAYYTLQMLDSKLDISRQTAASWKENVRIMRAMKEAGMVNEASVSQTEANSCSIEASLHDLEYQIRQTENTLSLLIGEAPQHITRGRFDKAAIGMDLSVGVPAQLLSRRPDVMSAEAEVRKAFYGTAAARAALYPSLRLNGAYGLEKALTGPAGMLLSLGASVTGPIFNAGRNRAALKTAKAQQEEAVAAFEQALLNAGSEVNNAVAKCQSAQNKTDIRIRQIEDLIKAENSTTQLMHNASATYLEVLTAQQSLLSARLLQVSDQFDAIDGMISLYKALGGGAQ